MQSVPCWLRPCRAMPARSTGKTFPNPVTRIRFSGAGIFMLTEKSEQDKISPKKTLKLKIRKNIKNKIRRKNDKGRDRIT